MSRALGRYELLRPLARGGMAEVFLARRRAAGVEKWLVVKRMRPERAGDARFLDLFVREARLSMSLAHQNIVPVFDFGRIDDQVFLAMERIEGKDLGSTLGRAGRAAGPLLAAFIAAECCQALDYAHRRKSPEGAPLGIVHRDVTPRNVLLSWSGEVKLTDFGIAALAGDEPMKMIGTPAYMAPEQARGEQLDARADIYAIGLVLREALTGVRPRPGDDRESTLAAARRGELVPWPEEYDGSPLRVIVDRATAFERDDRYPDARAMLEELDTFIVGERSARKSDSPARLLAAWLADVWKEEREESAIDEAIEGAHLVSFLDDGALDVVGTGTVRSMLATIGEEGAAAPGAEAAAAGTPVVAPVGSESTPKPASSAQLAAVAPPASEAAEAAAAAADAAPAPAAPAPRSRMWIGAAAVALLGGAAIVIGLRSQPERAGNGNGDRSTVSGNGNGDRSAVSGNGNGDRSTVGGNGNGDRSTVGGNGDRSTVSGNGDRSSVGGNGQPTTATDNRQPSTATDNRQPPTATATDNRQPPTATDNRQPSTATATGSAPAPAPAPAPHPGKPPRHAPASPSASASAAGSASASPTAPKCKVQINYEPWAYFTVDNLPTQYQTVATVELSPGPHRIHFTNPTLDIDVEKTVIVPADREDFRFSVRPPPSPSPSSP